MKALPLLLAALTALPCMAWDGRDSASGERVEIHKGNLVRQGNIIQVYDPLHGIYDMVQVRDIRAGSSAVELTVVDSLTGRERTLEMDKRTKPGAGSAP